MNERWDVPLSQLTTLRLGGPARRVLEPADGAQLIEALAELDRAREPVLLVSGGSNLVIADSGWDGTAVRISHRGVEREEARGERTCLRAAAGEPWDELVARTVEEGLAGFECLSGIPGGTGATPIQNVGAYGAEVAETIRSVRAYDRAREAVVDLSPEQCGFGYRTSGFKHSDRHLILDVAFELDRSPLGAPIRYAQLAAALGVDVGDRVPLGEAREGVLELRRAKGMVIDPSDPDSVSAGSFFTNPILGAEEFEAMADLVADRLGEEVAPPRWAEPGGGFKTSAAWLIERAGFTRGYGDGRAGISSKHTLALVNRGGAATAELVALAREIRDGVRDRFGVTLRPEPTLVGVEL